MGSDECSSWLNGFLGKDHCSPSCSGHVAALPAAAARRHTGNQPSSWHMRPSRVFRLTIKGASSPEIAFLFLFFFLTVLLRARNAWQGEVRENEEVANLAEQRVITVLYLTGTRCHLTRHIASINARKASKRCTSKARYNQHCALKGGSKPFCNWQSQSTTTGGPLTVIPVLYRPLSSQK